MSRRERGLQQNLLVVTYNKIDITANDLKCLASGEHINDNIINFYLKFLENQLLNDEQRQRIHICDTFFMASIETLDRSRIHRRLNRVDLFNRDYLLIPVHSLDHWYLLVLYHPNRIFTNDKHLAPKISIIDSKIDYEPEERERIVEALYEFIHSASVIQLGKSKREVGDLHEKVPYEYPDVYQQRNEYDCGICLMENAENFLIQTFNIAENQIGFRLFKNRSKRKNLRDLINTLAEHQAVAASASSK